MQVSSSGHEFQKVVYKRKGKNRRKCHNQLNKTFDVIADNSLFDLDLNVRRITEAKNELLSTNLFPSISALLYKCFASIGDPTISQIICFGLGKVSESTISRHQLALLLTLRDMLQVEISVSDPLFNNHDTELLNHFGIRVIEDNIEGKFEVHSNTVLFYLPHCPKQLMNNLLWCNWGLKLNKCVIIGNSITKVVENDDFKVSVKYISRICPYVSECAIVETSYKLTGVFNDTSIHVFPLDRLSLLPKDFWEDSCEPAYSCDFMGLITNNLRHNLIL